MDNSTIELKRIAGGSNVDKMIDQLSKLQGRNDSAQDQVDFRNALHNLQENEVMQLYEKILEADAGGPLSDVRMRELQKQYKLMNSKQAEDAIVKMSDSGDVTGLAEFGLFVSKSHLSEDVTPQKIAAGLGNAHSEEALQANQSLMSLDSIKSHGNRQVVHFQSIKDASIVRSSAWASISSAMSGRQSGIKTVA